MQHLYFLLLLLFLPLSGTGQTHSSSTEIIIVEEEGTENKEVPEERIIVSELPVELWDLTKCDKALSDLTIKLSHITDKEDPRYKKYTERIEAINARRKQLNESKK